MAAIWGERPAEANRRATEENAAQRWQPNASPNSVSHDTFWSDNFNQSYEPRSASRSQSVMQPLRARRVKKDEVSGGWVKPKFDYHKLPSYSAFKSELKKNGLKNYSPKVKKTHVYGRVCYAASMQFGQYSAASGLGAAHPGEKEALADMYGEAYRILMKIRETFQIRENKGRVEGLNDQMGKLTQILQQNQEMKGDFKKILQKQNQRIESLESQQKHALQERNELRLRLKGSIESTNSRFDAVDKRISSEKQLRCRLSDDLNRRLVQQERQSEDAEKRFRALENGFKTLDNFCKDFENRLKTNEVNWDQNEERFKKMQNEIQQIRPRNQGMTENQIREIVKIETEYVRIQKMKEKLRKKLVKIAPPRATYANKNQSIDKIVALSAPHYTMRALVGKKNAIAGVRGWGKSSTSYKNLARKFRRNQF